MYVHSIYDTYLWNNIDTCGISGPILLRNKTRRWILMRCCVKMELHATGPGWYPMGGQVLAMLRCRAVLREVVGRGGGWNWLRIVSEGGSCLGSVEASCYLGSCDRASWAKCEERENQQEATIRCLLSTSVSTCFGHHYTHLQENKDRVTASGVLLWFCWIWLVAVVGRCVVGCEQYSLFTLCSRCTVTGT